LAQTARYRATASTLCVITGLRRHRWQRAAVHEDRDAR